MFTASVLRHLTKRLPLHKVLQIIKQEVKKNSEGTQNPVSIVPVPALSLLDPLLYHMIDHWVPCLYIPQSNLDTSPDRSCNF